MTSKPLTSKQEKFAQCVASGMTQADAYRSAYNVGSTTKPETVVQKAMELAKIGYVSARVAELRKPIIEKVGITLENHIAELQSLKQLAKDAGNYAAAIKAEELRGKVCGLYVEKVQHSGTGEGGAIKHTMTVNLVKAKCMSN